MKVADIRRTFLNFYESKGHTIVASSPVVPAHDPTLLFTNAGMNQFKDVFLGFDKRPYTRATTSQKCIRAGGKHNDLDNVGYTARHHTFFEMLGNFSFGDYFKHDAINFAWELLTKHFMLPAEKLWVTVYAEDDEAYNIWHEEVGVPAERIVRIGDNKGARYMSDNFWMMGDTGPCGPCTEIFYDHGDKIQGGPPGSPEEDGDRYIEIWNLVFMQYNRRSDGSLEKLGMNVIDTGMGFERLVRILQGKHSNYDTDIFQPIIKEIENLSGLKYGFTTPSSTEDEGATDQEKVDIAMRVVADHLRAVAFSIADGQLPGNAKAGYVIRRILRRAVRYAYTFLGQKEAFMFRLVNVLIQEMGAAYPELPAQRELIARVIKEEEDSFLRTLDKGINLLNGEMDELKAHGEKELRGAQAFRLFDTYGFPLDLTELICRENGYTVNEQEFDEEMAKQKARARNAAQVENGDWVVLREGEQEFVGYDHTEYPCHILRYREVKQKKSTFFEVVLDYTPFYGEMGGQVGDQGKLVSSDETVVVSDTKRENNQSIHILKRMPQDPTEEFTACVDVPLREASARNHTATHLLDYALKQVLGDHVEQKGSYVSADTLRFDFSHFQKVTDEELRRVEQLVNSLIRQDIQLDEHRDMPMEEAKKLGAVALFGEKYGDRVRVVRFGPSCEFCGGIHVAATGRIGFFKIVGESSVAAGVRRIEAMTGEVCENAIYLLEDTLRDLKSLFNNAKDLKAVVTKYIDEHDHMKKEIDQFRTQAVDRMTQELVRRAEEVDGLRVVKAVVPLDPAAAKDLVFKVRQAIPDNLVCVVGSVHEDKPLLSVMFSDDLVASHELNAGKIIREAAKLIKGGGGGQPHYAQAGGKDRDGLAAAVDKVLELVRK